MTSKHKLMRTRGCVVAALNKNRWRVEEKEE